MPPRIAHILVQRGHGSLDALPDLWSGDPAAISARSRFVWRGEQQRRCRQRYGFSFGRLVTGVLHPSTSHGACSSGISIFLPVFCIRYRTRAFWRCDEVPYRHGSSSLSSSFPDQAPSSGTGPEPRISTGGCSICSRAISTRIWRSI